MPPRSREKTFEMDARNVKIRFTPKILDSLARLETALNGTNTLSPEMTETLRDLVAGKELSVFDAMGDILAIVEKAARRDRPTDKDMSEALAAFVEDLSGVELGPQFTLVGADLGRQR
jgi:hypothetical protein